MSGGGSSAASQAISGTGAITFNPKAVQSPWAIVAIVAAVLGGIGLLAWFSKK
ncbi:MAG: hypothetical protein QM813_09310 [Verrucomicrobiota bacterium]